MIRTARRRIHSDRARRDTQRHQWEVIIDHVRAASVSSETCSSSTRPTQHVATTKARITHDAMIIVTRVTCPRFTWPSPSPCSLIWNLLIRNVMSTDFAPHHSCRTLTELSARHSTPMIAPHPRTADRTRCGLDRGLGGGRRLPGMEGSGGRFGQAEDLAFCPGFDRGACNKSEPCALDLAVSVYHRANRAACGSPWGAAGRAWSRVERR